MTSNRSVSEMVLKPCPFCGGVPEELTAKGNVAHGGDCILTIVCSVEDWNTRASSQAQSDDVVERVAREVVMRSPPAPYPYNLYIPVTDAVRTALATLNESSAIGGGDGR